MLTDKTVREAKACEKEYRLCDAQYLPVRRKMLQWYADYLDALRDGQPVPPLPQH